MNFLNSIQKINHRHILPDLLIVTLSLFFSFYLRLGSAPELYLYLGAFIRYAPLFILLRIATYFFCGTYNVIWRYVSVRDSISLLKASLVSTLVIITFTFLFQLDRIPRSIYIIDGVISALGIVGIRVIRRYLFEAERSRIAAEDSRRILIYGAGPTGLSLLKQYASGSWSRGKVVGFIDDDPRKIGRLLSGVKIWGPMDKIPDVIRQYNAHEIVVAFRSPHGEVIRELVECSRDSRVQIRLLNDSSHHRKEVQLFDSTRKLQLSDLLSRPQRYIDQSRISSLVRGKRVLVTGAGGSIGSELCRQIFVHGPSQLLLLDNSELSLYQIDGELRNPVEEVGPVIPLLCDIRDQVSMLRVFEKYSPEIVFHAAAYKHVHLVECNPFSAILTNIEGTRCLVDLCLRFNIPNFVMISTDKAVNPVGVMGMTKRVCEMIVSTAGRESGRQFCSVRFGNVLGSSGSIVPLMQKQIENGGPITITHPEMQRYLMLIPEAVALVLTAGTLGNPGDILLLKMGGPIRILDLAKNLLALYGQSEAEIPIVYTGIRPGEKLVEELYLVGNEVQTQNPDVLILPKGDAVPGALSYRQLSGDLDQLLCLVRQGDASAVEFVRKMVKHNTVPSTPPTDLPLIPRGEVIPRSPELVH